MFQRAAQMKMKRPIDELGQVLEESEDSDESSNEAEVSKYWGLKYIIA